LIIGGGLPAEGGMDGGDVVLRIWELMKDDKRDAYPASHVDVGWKNRRGFGRAWIIPWETGTSERWAIKKAPRPKGSGAFIRPFQPGSGAFEHLPASLSRSPGEGGRAVARSPGHAERTNSKRSAPRLAMGWGEEAHGRRIGSPRFYGLFLGSQVSFW
jgi:hypothetical protein